MVAKDSIQEAILRLRTRADELEAIGHREDLKGPAKRSFGKIHGCHLAASELRKVAGRLEEVQK